MESGCDNIKSNEVTICPKNYMKYGTLFLLYKMWPQASASPALWQGRDCLYSNKGLVL